MMQGKDIELALAGGDRRSIGRANEIAEAACRDRSLVAPLVDALVHQDGIVRMRAADALEKVQRRIPEEVEQFRRRLLELAETSTQQELRWHFAQILPRMALTDQERSRLVAALDGYFSDASAIVRVSALQALADIAEKDGRFLPKARRRIRIALQDGTAAERARARKLQRISRH